MLISYPALAPAKMDESDQGGRYPIGVFTDSKHEGLTAGWHGGLHLKMSPTTTQGPVVRAIADGIVVAYRVPTPKTNDPDHALHYGGKWTDDGFVLLKHEKECGEGRPVVFYSLYMHLNKIVHQDLLALKNEPGKPIPNPKKQIKEKGKVREESIQINRKAPLGHAGEISGQSDLIHFEVFTTDEHLKKFYQPKMGRMDPWGNLYFILPEGTPYFSEKPKTGTNPPPKGNTPIEYRLELVYQDGDIHFRVLDNQGFQREAWCENGQEYTLYQEAREQNKGALSRSYELVRFGRYMDWPDLDQDPKPSEAHCWHHLPMVNGWVDFANCNIQKYSDADFPEWQWQAIPAENAGIDPVTGLCVASRLLSSLDENGDGNVAADEFKAWIKIPENKALLRRMAVQHKSEWDGSDAESRWNWIKEMWGNPVKHEQEALKRKIAWIEAQKTLCANSLPELERRMKRAKGWRERVAAMKAEAEKALEDTKQAVANAKKALLDFDSEAQAQLEPKTPPAKHQNAVKIKIATLKKTWNDAQSTEKQAEIKLKAFPAMLASAEAWLKHEEAKYDAADAMVGLAEPLIVYVKKSLEASAQKTVEPDAEAQANKDFEDYKKHMMALQFLDKVPDFRDSNVWHFHPLAFIDFFKRCHWLSMRELGSIYADTSESIRETYRIHLNRVMWKYGVTTPKQMTHFLGQGWVESRALKGMVEGSTIYPNESTASESNGYYQNPLDYYYTQIQTYEKLSWGGNTDKEDLLDAQGKPVNIKESIKKSNEDLDEKIRRLKIEKETLTAQLLQEKTKPTKDDIHIKSINENLKTKSTELNKLEDSKKKPRERYQQIARSTIDLSKSRSGDGMKFRGRGMKQLMARANYASYWVYRGWLNRESFDSPWWNAQTLSNGKRAPVIDDPQRISTIPFNCIDTGGWFWEAGKGKSLNHLIKEIQPIENGIIRQVSIAINGINKVTVHL